MIAQQSWANIGIVAGGGAVGTGLRYAISLSMPTPASVPLAILGINVLGAFLLGVLLERLARHGADDARSRRIRLGIGTGGLGGFTTYSALATETVTPWRRAPRPRHRVRPWHRGHWRSRQHRRYRTRSYAESTARVVTRAAFSDLGTALLICLAGGVGAALRLVIDSLIRTRLKSTYPVGTAVINLTGSLLLGLLTGLTTGHLVPQQYQLIIGTGLLGGYTTFSAASV
ncbi:MAG TPA: CrcB family protein, partial [Propionibacteriaceae bacterium]|nr:CrcB family protein [Propionibacteriaceae bacterium]